VLSARTWEERQRVLADFGELALRSQSLDEVLTEACRLIGAALGTELAKVVEIEHASSMLYIRAGVGWPPGVVGCVRLPMGQNISETYAIEHRVPVLVPDISRETRFAVPDFMVQAGVRGMINVPVFLPGGEAYGLLQVDSRDIWEPEQHDIEFLRTYATILGPVIDRLHKLHALNLAEQRNAVLLHELQHRVKNNIAAIASMVHLQMRQAPTAESRAELHVVADRVRALSLVHEGVYASGDGDRLPLRPYITRLLGGLTALHPQVTVDLDIQIDSVDLGSDAGITLGLILNEFATNSLKHAWPEGGRGKLVIEARKLGQGLLRVCIADDGPGLPGTLAEAQPGHGTGLTMIGRLARQIGAVPQWRSHEGAELILEFPLQARERLALG
jgi:two-component sensor histidine kinase